jgi:hypothetical protein
MHLATLTHEGRLWDAYLELDDDPQRPDSFRARLRFDSPHGGEAHGTYRTTVIIIEPSYEEAVARARALDPQQMQGLLRSVLPETDSDASEGAAPDA